MIAKVWLYSGFSTEIGDKLMVGPYTASIDNIHALKAYLAQVSIFIERLKLQFA